MENYDFSIFGNIPTFTSWQSISKIDEGWSNDTKYHIMTNSGEHYLLRVGDLASYKYKQHIFHYLKRINQLNFDMSKALSVGKDENNRLAYMLLSYIPGKSLRATISSLSSQEQYKLGVKSGEILKSIHTIPVKDTDFKPSKLIAKKLRQLDDYANSDYRVAGDEAQLDFVRQHLSIFNTATAVYQHGDFHLGNLILTPDKHIGVIDFDRFDIGDPYEEFYKLELFGVEDSVPFSVGMIDGYFEKAIPDEFWARLKLYAIHAAMFSILWAAQFSETEVSDMKVRYSRIIDDYSADSIIPKWYVAFANC